MAQAKNESSVRTKSEVSSRRLVAFQSLIFGGLFFFGVRHLIPTPLSVMHGVGIDVQTMPPFFRSFLPLDLIATCGWFWLTMYLMIVVGIPKDGPSGTRGWTKFVLGILTAIGGLGGVLMTVAGGWLLGIEGALLLALLGGAFMASILTMLGTVFLAGLGIHKAALVIWPHVRRLPVIRPFLRLAGYLHADNVPEDSSQDS